MKKAIALMLATSMAIGMSSVAFAALPADPGLQDSATVDDSVVDGSGDVNNPIISYQIPSNLNFALNAFQKGDASGSQVFSPEFSIINKCDVALQVSVKPKIVAVSGVTIGGAPDEVNSSDPAVLDKQVYMEAAAYSTLTGAGAPSANGTDITGAALAYDPAGANKGADTKAKCSIGTGTDASLVFALAEGAYPDPHSSASDYTGVTKTTADSRITSAAKFRFMGSVNPMPKYDTNDVKVQAVFSFNLLTPTMYESLIGDPNDSSVTIPAGAVQAANVAKTTSAKPTNYAPSAPSDLEYNGTDATFDVDLDVGGGNLAIATVTGVKLTATGYSLSSADYAYADGTITFKGAAITQMKKGNTGFTLVYTIAGGESKELSFTINKA